MNLSARGKPTSTVEVTHISSHGVWLLCRDHELLMAYEHFPWFKDQPVKAIINVQEPSPGHFYWPDIDVDLTEDMIEHPERFQNVAR